jgi:hypothetical protein
MKEEARALAAATKALVEYIEQNQVYDKLSDCGCGLYDSYRSDAFDAALANAKQALQALEAALQAG